MQRCVVEIVSSEKLDLKHSRLMKRVNRSNFISEAEIVPENIRSIAYMFNQIFLNSNVCL